MSSRVDWFLTHANAIPLKNQYNTRGKRGMQRALRAPFCLAEEFPFQQFHACGKQIVIGLW